MDSFIISAKFLGTQIEFTINDHHIYTLATLWADVYIYAYSTLPHYTERFKMEAKIPYSGEYKIIADDECNNCLECSNLKMLAGSELMSSCSHFPNPLLKIMLRRLHHQLIQQRVPTNVKQQLRKAQMR
ncbi:hypothetical protein ACOSQ4_023404 [Xanthoceras sorbifolium]